MTAPPDPSNPDLLKGLRAYLVSQGIVREPRDGTNAALPPLWLAPKLGTPGPGQTEGLSSVEVGQDAVLSVAKATGIPSPPYQGFIRNDGLEFVLRARSAPIAYSLEQKIRALLNDRRNWMMDNVPVNESMLFRDLQPISSDNFGFTFNFEYMFNLWAPFASVNP